MAFSQKSGPKVLRLPHDFEMPKGTEEFDPENQTTTPWYVYSDRSDNITYRQASSRSGETGKTLQFLDKLVVTAYQGDFLHVYKYDIKKIKNTNKGSSSVLTSDAEDLGWIEKSKVILWKNALYSENSTIIKALPAIQDNLTILNIKKYIQKGGSIILYDNPYSSKPNNQQVKMSDFLYVYKREVNNRILVGRSLKISSSNPSSTILGWVDKSIVKVWEDRICLEPNSDPEAIAERRKAGIKASLLSEVSSAKSYQKSGTGSESELLWSDDPYDKPKNTQYLKFPVIGTNDNVVETGVLTSIVDKNGNEVVNLNDQSKVDEKYNKKRAQLRTINMVFVIDGSESVADYMPAITKAMNDIKEKDEVGYENKKNYAVVLYRDYDDASCNLDKEKLDLTNDPNEISKFLEKEANKQGCAGKSEPTQAVRLGLYTALKMLDDGEKTEQSNFIILIGGAGDKVENMDSKYSSKILAKMMAKVQAHLMVYQVNNAVHPAYRRFVADNMKLFIAASEVMRDDMKSNEVTKDLKDFTPQWLDAIDQYTYRIDYKTTATYSSIVFPDQGEPMKSEKLSEELTNMMDTIYQVIENKVNGLSRHIEGVGQKNVEDIEPSIRILLYSLSKSSDPKILSQYLEDNYQFFVRAYTTFDCQKLKYPLFKRVLFISDDEYQDLGKILRTFTNLGGNDYQQRQQLMAAFYTIVNMYYGEEAKERFKKMSMDDILNLITGLKSDNVIFSKVKVNDFTDQKKLPDDQFQDIVEYLDRANTKYRTVRANPDYMLRKGDDIWYWLPEDFLP